MSAPSVRHRCVGAFLAVLVMVCGVVACGAKQPDLAADQSASFDRLTGADGQSYLQDISVYEWDDKGAAAAKSIAWIATDAASTDPGAAARAGRAANAIATYLGGSGTTLIDGKQRLGQRNPELVRAYAAALTPFQGAMIGERPPAGFTSLTTTSGDYSAARNVFAVIDTDTPAGNAFTAKAYEKADDYARQFGANFGKPADEQTATLSMAAYLSGVAFGGAQSAKNGDIVTRTSQEANDWAAYEVAAALQPAATLNDFDPQFFTREDTLKPPDKVAGEGDKVHYSEQLRRWVSHREAIGLLLNEFTSQFNHAAGTG